MAGSRPLPAPAGATSATPTTTTTRAAIPTAACPARRASARRGRPADHGERAVHQRRAASASSARPTPQRAATPVRSRLPPRRSVGTSGEPTWPRATSPSGKPPNGTRSRAHSAAIMATGKPMATDDRRLVGTSATAAVVYRPLTTMSAIQPGMENSWTHHSPMTN